jgi:hypothetical protein
VPTKGSWLDIHVMAAEIAELPHLGLPEQAGHDFR